MSEAPPSFSIERLAAAIERLEGSTSRKLDTIAAGVGRLDADQKLLIHEVSMLARRVADHELRISELEQGARLKRAVGRVHRKK